DGRDVRAADGTRGVDAVDQDALAELDVEPARQLGQGLAVGRVDAVAEGGEGDRAVHGARVEVGDPEPAGHGPRHRRLSGPGGTVDRYDRHRHLSPQAFEGIEV